MKKRYVLDTGFFVLYFAGDERAKKIVNEIYTEKATAYTTEANMAELVYNYARVFGWEAALVKHAVIRESPIEIVPLDEALSLEAARLKLIYYSRLSLVDCYLIALARQRRATIVTTDSSIHGVREAHTMLLK